MGEHCDRCEQRLGSERHIEELEGRLREAIVVLEPLIEYGDRLWLSVLKALAGKEKSNG